MKDTTGWTLRCDSDFKLVSLCIRRLRAFGVTNHVTTTRRSSGRKSPRKSVKSVNGGTFKPNNLSGLKPSCPSCLCGEILCFFDRLFPHAFNPTLSKPKLIVRRGGESWDLKKSRAIAGSILVSAWGY